MATNELKTNKVRRLRGSASIREDGTFDFRPDGQGTSKQEDIKTVRKSRSYRTSGEKQQSIVAHIVVAADTKDPAYEMYRDFREITKDLGGFEPNYSGLRKYGSRPARLTLTPRESTAHGKRCLQWRVAWCRPPFFFNFFFKNPARVENSS
jgi:hypothetical protein